MINSEVRRGSPCLTTCWRLKHFCLDYTSTQIKWDLNCRVIFLELEYAAIISIIRGIITQSISCLQIFIFAKLINDTGWQRAIFVAHKDAPLNGSFNSCIYAENMQSMFASDFTNGHMVIVRAKNGKSTEWAAILERKYQVNPTSLTQGACQENFHLVNKEISGQLHNWTTSPYIQK